jgi:hypothetical protein
MKLTFTQVEEARTLLRLYLPTTRLVAAASVAGCGAEQAFLTIAGGKKKNSLPPCILNARTILVLIDPEAGTSVDTPLANKTAQEDVEKAFMKWGRLKLHMGTAIGVG